MYTYIHGAAVGGAGVGDWRDELWAKEYRAFHSYCAHAPTTLATPLLINVYINL